MINLCTSFFHSSPYDAYPMDDAAMDNGCTTRYPSGMEKLYYTSPYLKSTPCRIEKVSIDGKAGGKADFLVSTDRTVFYPECGGQPGDRGSLGPYQVVDTRKASDGDSVLVVQAGEGEQAPQVGMELELSLDWSHRYKYMAMHTAQHMLSGLLYTQFGIGTVAVHLGEDYLTIEVDRRDVDDGTVKALVAAANDAIAQCHGISYHEMSHKDAEALGLRRSIKVDGDVRIVEIEGVDRIACGGVHVANTSEVRLVYCVKHESIRGHERLYFKCGADAVEHAVSSVALCEDLALKLSCRADEVPGKVMALNGSLNTAMHEKTDLMKRLAAHRLDECLEDGVAAFIDEDLELSAFVQASNQIEDLALCVVKPCEGRSLWLIVLKGRYEGIGFASLKNSLLSRIDAKGGGRPPVYQGSSPCTDRTSLSDFLESFKSIVGMIS